MPDQVLIIEDDEVTRYACERALLNAGYRVAGYANYFAAAEAINRGEGAVLILDLKLPAGTPHGMSVARMVRSRRLDLPLIFVTGDPDYAEHADAELGRLLTKPVELATLVAAVRSQLGR